MPRPARLRTRTQKPSEKADQAPKRRAGPLKRICSKAAKLKHPETTTTKASLLGFPVREQGVLEVHFPLHSPTKVSENCGGGSINDPLNVSLNSTPTSVSAKSIVRSAYPVGSPEVQIIEDEQSSSPSLHNSLSPSEEDLVADAWWHFQVVYPTLRSAERKQVGMLPCTASKEEVAAMVDSVVREHEDYELRPTTLFLTVTILFRFLALQHVDAQYHQLLGATALFIASKFEEENPPDAVDLVRTGFGAFTSTQVVQMELVVMRALEYRLHIPTAAHHLDWFQTINNSGCKVQRYLVQYLGELGLTNAGVVNWPPTLHAAAAVILANSLLQQTTPEVLCALCVGSQPQRSVALHAIVTELRLSLTKVSQQGALYQKYARKDYEHVAVQTRMLLAAFNARRQENPANMAC